MRARELMTPDPECLTADATVQHAAERMRDLDVGILPVVADSKGTRLQGVITDRDIAIRHVAEGRSGDGRVADVMTRDNLYTVKPDDDLNTVMERMKAGQVRRVPVMDEDRIVGIIAQADLAVETPEGKAEEVEKTVERISEPAQPAR